MILKHVKKAILFTFILALSITQVAFSQTSTLYDFNTSGQLATYFNANTYQLSAGYSATGGIGGSGALNIDPTNDIRAVYTTKDGYSIGPVGSTYKFESLVKSEGANGYSGMGFTTGTPATVTISPSLPNPFRPDIALGVSVHGSGFIIHNDGTNLNGYWDADNYSSIHNAAIIKVKKSSCIELISGNNTSNANNGCASSTGWYKIVLILEKKSSTTFDLTVEVWVSDSNGNLLNSATGADAIYKMIGLTNTSISNASVIYSYFNLSGKRFAKFDNYAINLSGGATVVQAGMPVVVTSSTTVSNRVVTVNGNVTSVNGSAVTERGFVFGKSPNPTLSDTKIAVGSGAGNFSGTTPSLPPGTYYFRTFATNSTGTSYGSQEQQVVTMDLSTLGCVNIVSSGGAAEGTGWTYSFNTIMPTSATSVSINASDVLAKMALGNLDILGSCINVNADVNYSANTNGITLKASGDIIVAAGKSIATSGGKVILWSDLDATGTTTTAGGTISLLASSSISTAGGNIVLAGGTDSDSDGIPDGYAIGAISTTAHGASPATAGLFMDAASLNAGTGSVLLRGQGTGNLQNFQIGTRLYGGSIIGSDIKIEAKGSILGASSSNWGLSLEGFSIAGSGDITLNGWGGRAGSSNSDANQVGVEIRRALDNTAKHSEIKATGSGTISINGLGGSGTLATVNVQAVGVRIEAGQTSPILSANGNIILNGTSGYNGRGPAIMVGSPISSTNGNITLKGNASVEGILNQNGNVEISSTVSTGGDLNIESPGAVTQTAAITADKLSLTGTGSFTLSNTSNNVATIAGGDNTTKLGAVSFTDASGGLIIGTANSKNGITSTGTILVETLSGNVTLSQNISTTNTSADAVIVNAGKSAAIGTASGGNIIISGAPIINTGTGGIVKLFSGSEAASTGLTSLVGGASNTRSSVDETTTTFTPSLTTGKYALYRASNFTAPSITSFTPEIAGNGETVIITGTGFTGTTAVKFGNIIATSFTVVSDTEISAKVGTGTSGSVEVTNPAGSASKTGFIFKVVHYQFEDNTLDKTDANLDATIVGSATYGNGASGRAICFTNNNVVGGTTVQNYLLLPNNLIRGRGANFTISLRFKTNTFGGILAYQNAAVGGGSQYVPILYIQTDGKLSANLWQGDPLNSPLTVKSTNRVDDGNWHKVEFAASSGSLNVYIDGVLAGTSVGTADPLAMNFNQLGAVNTLGVWDGDPINGWFGFNGCIDEFFIIEKALSASQIQQVTQLPQPTIGSFTPTTAKSGETITITGTNLDGTSSVKIGGVEVRSFTVVSATEIKAIVGKDATVNNTVAVTTAAGTVSSNGFTFSCSSNSFDFDGVNDYIEVGAPLPLTSSDNFTFEAWVKPNVINSNYQGFLGVQSANGLQRSPSMWVGPNGTLHSDAYNGGNRYDMVANNFFTVNKWTHVAYVKNGSVLSLYKNGVLVQSRTANASIDILNLNFWIGKVDNLFNGSMDEVRIWNVARTAQQITDNFTVEMVGNETGLKAYYNFNQGTAGGNNAGQTIVNNLTATANLNGTVTSAALSGNASNYVLGYWPLIMTQPAATLSACKNASTGNTLSVSAVGNKLTYQWYSNTTNSTTGGTAIANANTASFNVPTATAGTAYYYVVVSNDCNAGSVTSDVTTVTINALPTIAYTNTSYSFQNGQAISTVTPTATDAVSFSVSPALPAGLAFSTTTGAISGTPTAAAASASYTVTARSSSNCAATATVTIVVNNAVAPSSMTFSPSTQTVRLNAPISDMTPSSSGGTVVSYTIDPALPAGLSLNPTTGVISGTLTAATTGSITYTITATNTGGSTTSTVTLVYNTAPTNISISPLVVNENAASGTVVGTLSATDADAGDTFTYTLVSGTGSTDNVKFKISGSSLVTDAVFDFETKSSYSILVKVTDAGGLSFEKSFTITVKDLDNEDTDGDGIEDSIEKGSDPATPVDTDGDGIPDFKDTDADNDGVPDAVERTEGTSPTDKTKYKDSDGDGVPDYVEIQNGTDPLDPKKYKDSDGDGVPDYVEILDGTNPNSATSFKDTDRGGVPDYVETKVLPLYGVPASNPSNASDDNQDTDGDGVSDYAEIKAGTNPNDAPSNLRLSPSSLTAEKGTAITVVIPGYEKGKPTSFSISPNLPAGLTMNPVTGVISGTPTVLLVPAVVYTITATNNGGSTTASFTLGVNDVPPSALKLTPSTQISEQGKAITTMTPSSNGGPVVSYTISPALPAGLTFNTTTGVISGTRTQSLTGTVTYTITAINSGGSTTSTITLTYNSAPTDIATSKANIYEGNNVGEVIGLLSTTDLDNPETHTYTLVMSGTNAFDNKNFKIVANRLVADTTFNFAFKNAYVVRVRSTDSQGLFTEKNFSISISKRPEIFGTHSEAHVTASGQGISNSSTSPVISKGYSSQLQITGADIRSVSWSPATGLSSTTSLNPVFKHTSSVTFTVTITNIYGSVIQLPFTVEVRDDYFIKPTNILTTRKDGINDYFTIENIESYPDNEVTIYDRNGKILTRMANYNNRWDGKINGQYLSNETYYYLIRFTKNAQAPVKGFITIINN